MLLAQTTLHACSMKALSFAAQPYTVLPLHWIRSEDYISLTDFASLDPVALHMCLQSHWHIDVNGSEQNFPRGPEIIFSFKCCSDGIEDIHWYERWNPVPTLLPVCCPLQMKIIKAKCNNGQMFWHKVCFSCNFSFTYIIVSMIQTCQRCHCQNLWPRLYRSTITDCLPAWELPATITIFLSHSQKSH